MLAAALYQNKIRWIFLPLIALGLALFFKLSQILLPLPPTVLTLTAGRTGGMYQEHAQAYRKLLAGHGIDLTILESAGTGENLQRLRDPNHPAQVGFAQGGYSLGESSSADSVGLQTLAQVDIEPVWVFSRFTDVDSLLRLQGQKVSIGPIGSGSRVVALQLLRQVRLEAKDLLEAEVAGLEIADAFQAGKLDAAIFVAAVKAPLVQKLLAMPGVYLAPIKRSAALSERMPYLDARFAASGSLLASRQQPAQDMVLLSTVASVLAREQLHPMVQRVLMHVMQQQHAASGALHRANEFPHLKRLEFPSAPQARQVLSEGLPWLEQKLTVQMAQWIYRLTLIGLPMGLLVAFLCRLIPGYLMWRIDSRVNRWYGELKFIENDLNQGQPGGLEMAQFRTRLRNIAQQVAGFPMPRHHMQRLLILQQHIALVEAKMQASHGR